MHPLDRALCMLSIADTGVAPDQLTKLNIGKRDSLLLDLYEKAFGQTMECFTTCSNCSENCEFTMSTTDIKDYKNPTVSGNNELMELVDGLITFSFRLPDSTDLAAIIGFDTETAHTHLLRRCVTGAHSNGMPLSDILLTDDNMAAIALAMTRYAPLADIILDTQCPACGQKSRLCFDIVSFLWDKIVFEAKLLVREIHALAREYGWSEYDILSMSAARRHIYLEMVS